MAHCTLFLASRVSSYVTGAILVADGGAWLTSGNDVSMMLGERCRSARFSRCQLLMVERGDTAGGFLRLRETSAVCMRLEEEEAAGGGGGGGWVTADADARAFLVCDQHRWSCCLRHDGAVRADLTHLSLPTGSQRGSAGTRRAYETRREKRGSRLVPPPACLVTDTGGFAAGKRHRHGDVVLDCEGAGRPRHYPANQRDIGADLRVNFPQRDGRRGLDRSSC
ncbi:unnamed protein product [Pleuronectes platessa]|uniref:Uncharacterized protein n=1 Tax=Pleuronectes platessa TaxID=8262 RepID=A0A9N7U946_PLEPL|nr:unnamed protein product [Pleuronectes platessa]